MDIQVFAATDACRFYSCRRHPSVVMAGLAACARPRSRGGNGVSGVVGRVARRRLAARRIGRFARSAGRHRRNALAAARAQRAGRAAHRTAAAAPGSQWLGAGVHRAVARSSAACQGAEDGRCIVVRRANPALRQLRGADFLGDACAVFVAAAVASGGAVGGNAVRHGAAAHGGPRGVAGAVAAGAASVGRRIDGRHREATRACAHGALVDSSPTHACFAVSPCASFSPSICRNCR